MSDPTTEFFDRLSRRGHEPLLAEMTGTVRFDLGHDGRVDRWFVGVRRGNLGVSRQEQRAESVVSLDKSLFDLVVCGREHLYAAWVRNDVRVEGDVLLARLMQRVFPGPSGAHHPRAFARERGQRS